MVIINSISYSASLISIKNQNRGYISVSILPFIKAYKHSVINAYKADEINIFRKRIKLYSDFTKESVALIRNYFKKLSIIGVNGVDSKWLLSQVRKIILFLKHIELLKDYNGNLKNSGEEIFFTKNHEAGKLNEKYEIKVCNNFETDVQGKVDSFINNSTNKIMRKYIHRSKSLPHRSLSVLSDNSNIVIGNIHYSVNKNSLTPYIGKKFGKISIPTYRRSIGQETLVYTRNTPKRRTSQNHIKTLYSDVNRNQESTKSNKYTDRSNVMRSVSAFTHLNKVNTCQKSKFQQEPPTKRSAMEGITKNQDPNSSVNIHRKFHENARYKEQRPLVSLTKVILEGPYEYS
ncbi:hypothetical protein FG379_001987 [Cryptosporidium bovis]|uniref:uncharacterized protein n=1 Tax=Cryptosporidium bovis TaxID=310047 RepID=UPI00351A1F67|nr:hypothetical protein FG379_001987 [Cryptosporidium bovis]